MREQDEHTVSELEELFPVTRSATIPDVVGAVLDGAACRSDLEVLALLDWRITRTTQALQLLDLSGPRG